MTTSESPIDVEALTRLANELFRQLPGDDSGRLREDRPGTAPAVPATGSAPAVPATGSTGDAEPLSRSVLAGLPLSLVGSYPAPAGSPDGAADVPAASMPTTASAPTMPGGTTPTVGPLADVAPAAAQPGPPADSALRGAMVATPTANPVPVPTLEQLAAIPFTLTDVMGFVADVPGFVPDAPGRVPDAPGRVPDAPGPLPDGGSWPAGADLVDPAAATPPAGVPQATASGVVPAALPGAPAAVPAPLVEPSPSGAARPALAHSEPSVSDPSHGSDQGRIERVSVFQFHPQMLPSLQGSTVAVRPFDPYAIRRDFPILSERVHGRPLIWLDNGATTQKPRSVIDRVSSFYEHENSNIHRAAHALAARATDAYEGAREKVRRFLNAGSASEIVFVRGATEGINLVAKSWGAAHVGPGDEVLVTHLEHHANIVPWQQLCHQVGATLTVAPVDDTGQIILSEYERLITPRTKLVAMTHVSNALGTITPVEEMVAIAHRHGVRTLVDAAQSVLHMQVDVQAIGTDFLVFSGHKVFAPTGIGVVYGTADAWSVTPPWQGGGNMIADVTFDNTVYQPPPNRYEAGTGNIADAVGLGAALDYLTAVGIHNVTAHEQALLEYGTAGLRTIPGLRLIGTAAHKAAVMSFVLDGHTTEEVGRALDADGIAVRAGHHCAQPILRRFGVESTVRPSLAMYNTQEDLDILIGSLRRLTAGRSTGL